MKINKDLVKETGDLIVDSIKTKNLCNINLSGMFPNTNGTVVKNVCYTTIIDVSKMSYLYISGNFSLLSDGLLRIGRYNSYPKQGSSGTRSGITQNGMLDVRGTNYLLLAFVLEGSSTLEQLKNSFMVTEGTTAIAFKRFQNLDATDNIYSDIETKIGTWIDGKPLYRKVYETPVLTSSERIIMTITNEVIQKMEGFLWRDAGNCQPYGSFVDYSSTATSRCFCDGTYVKVQQGTNFQNNNFKARVIIEYTKTTD